MASARFATRELFPGLTKMKTMKTALPPASKNRPDPTRGSGWEFAKEWKTSGFYGKQEERKALWAKSKWPSRPPPESFTPYRLKAPSRSPTIKGLIQVSMQKTETASRLLFLTKWRKLPGA